MSCFLVWAISLVNDSVDSCRRDADRDGISQKRSTIAATYLNLATLLPSATSISNFICRHFADNSLDTNALACTLCLCTAVHVQASFSIHRDNCVGNSAGIHNSV